MNLVKGGNIALKEAGIIDNLLKIGLSWKALSDLPIDIDVSAFLLTK